MVDTLGLVLKAFVTEAHYYDGTVGTWLLPDLVQRFPRLKKLWADHTYTGECVEQARAVGIDIEITTRLSEQPGFQVIAWSRDGTTLIEGGGTHTIQIWDLRYDIEPRSEMATLDFQESFLRALERVMYIDDCFFASGLDQGGWHD